MCINNRKIQHCNYLSIEFKDELNVYSKYSMYSGW